MELETGDLPTHAHRLAQAGGRGLYAMAAEAEAGDDIEKTSRFVLYGGGEVRYNPMWQQGGDVIATRELNLKRYKLNPVALLEHNPDLVIGTGEARVENAGDIDRLIWTVTWDLHPTNPTAILVAGQHARGVRRAVSIGFMPGKDSVSRAELPKKHPYHIETEAKWSAGMYYRHAEMYEGSSVSIPKDPTALQLQAWAMEAEDPDERLRRIVREVLSEQAGAVVLQAVRSDPAIRTAIESAALGSLPTPSPAAPSEPVPDWFESWS